MPTSPPAPRVSLEPITPRTARRIVERDEHPEDRWHPEYPFVDELDPLRSLAQSASPDPVFTMYLLRRTSDGLAVGGLGFFGPPDAQGTVELGYGLVPAARGRGLAAEAVTIALRTAAQGGAHLVSADTTTDNIASQRVLLAAGFAETARTGTVVAYGCALAPR